MLLHLHFGSWYDAIGKGWGRIGSFKIGSKTIHSIAAGIDRHGILASSPYHHSVIRVKSIVLLMYLGLEMVTPDLYQETSGFGYDT